MKIVHVSNFPLKPKGAFQHGAAPKISNGLIRNGHFVANFSDRDVARAHSLLHNRKWGVIPANKVLRRFCADMRPDLMLLGHADVIRPATIAQIRTDLPDMRVLQWNVDPLFEPDNIPRVLSKADVVDATLVTTAGEALRVVARKGMRLGFMPNPVDYSIESGRNHEIADLPFDVFCACGDANMPRHIGGETISIEGLLTRLHDAIPALRFRLAGPRGHPFLVGHAFQTALESAATGLNVSRRNDALLYSSDRMAQMIGNGIAALVDRRSGYPGLFGEDQIAFFDTIPEMIEQVGRLVSHPDERMKLAASGRARYHQLFNEQVVAKYIVDVAFDQHDPRDYEWPTLLAEA